MEETDTIINGDEDRLQIGIGGIMWIAIIGASCTGKSEIADLVSKRGFEIIKNSPIDGDNFGAQVKYLSRRIRTHLEAQKIMNRRDVVTMHSVYDCHSVYSKMLLDGEKITAFEYKILSDIYHEITPILEPPNAIVYTKSSPMNAVNRSGLKRAAGMTSDDYNNQLKRFESFVESIRVPRIDVNLDQTMDVIQKEFDFNFSSIKATNVAGQTLWKRSFERDLT